MVAPRQRHLLIATRNTHKTAEFVRLLHPHFTVRDLTSTAELPEIEESGSTFEENATLKAVGISRLVPEEVVLADDSGLEVRALGGAPGVRSARYAGTAATDFQNVEKLLRELRTCGATRPAQRQAQFRCVLVLAKDGAVLHVVEGTVMGSIAETAAGSGGFGYDPVFIPTGYSTTFAELPAGTKNQISHRARAAAELMRWLAAEPGVSP
ncbi:N/A [soil metagenome]